MKNKTAVLELSCLLLALAFVFSLHLYYLSELYYDHDIPRVAYNTLDLIKGRGWYYSIWQPKPPGINLIYLFAFKVFGQSFKSIYITAFFFNALSIFLLYLIGKKILAKEIKFYYLLPVIFGLFCVSEPLQGNSANAETFFITFEIAAMLFLGLNRYMISGLILGTGFIIKQHVLATAAAAFIYIIMSGSMDKKDQGQIIKNIISFALAFIAPLVLISVYFLSLGVFKKFITYTFVYSFKDIDYYLGDLHKYALYYSLEKLWNNLSHEIILFLIFSAAAVFSTLIYRTKTRFYCAIWFLSVCFFLFRSGMYKHHFLQLIAPLALVSVVGLSDMHGYFKSLFVRKGLVGSASFNNVCLIIFSYGLFALYMHMAKLQLSEKKFWKGSEDRFWASKYIREKTSAKDRIFVWDGPSTGAVFMWSQRDNITRYPEKELFLPKEAREKFWLAGLRDHKFNQKWLLSDLRSGMPLYIMVVKTAPEREDAERAAFPEFFDTLDKRYSLEKEVGECLIYRIN